MDQSRRNTMQMRFLSSSQRPLSTNIYSTPPSSYLYNHPIQNQNISTGFKRSRNYDDDEEEEVCEEYINVDQQTPITKTVFNSYY